MLAASSIAWNLFGVVEVQTYQVLCRGPFTFICSAKWITRCVVTFWKTKTYMLIHWHTYLLHYPYTQHTLIYTCTSTLSTSWVDTLPNSMKWPTFSIYMKLGHVWAIAYFVTNKCFVTAIQHRGIKWENEYIYIHMYLNINKHCARGVLFPM